MADCKLAVSLLSDCRVLAVGATCTIVVGSGIELADAGCDISSVRIGLVVGRDGSSDLLVLLAAVGWLTTVALICDEECECRSTKPKQKNNTITNGGQIRKRCELTI